jgi:uncharacterized protein YciI
MAQHRFLVVLKPEKGWDATKDWDTTKGQAKPIEEQEKAYILEAYKSGGALSVGRFADPSMGALGLFETQEQAEAFVKDDPFINAGLHGSYEIHEFNEVAAAAPVPA